MKRLQILLSNYTCAATAGTGLSAGGAKGRGAGGVDVAGAGGVNGVGGDFMSAPDADADPPSFLANDWRVLEEQEDYEDEVGLCRLNLSNSR
jgi:hypothetical protein